MTQNESAVTAPRIRGRITSLDPTDRFGFLESEEAIEVYFTAADVKARFDDLAVGTAVEFLEEEGDHGFMARDVDVLQN